MARRIGDKLGLKFWRFFITRKVVAFTCLGWADELEKIDFNEKIRSRLVSGLRFIAKKVGG